MESFALSRSWITAGSYLRSDMSLTLEGAKSSAGYRVAVIKRTARTGIRNRKDLFLFSGSFMADDYYVPLLVKTQIKKPIPKRPTITPIITPLSRGFSLQDGSGRQSKSTKKPINLFKPVIRTYLILLISLFLYVGVFIITLYGETSNIKPACQSCKYDCGACWYMGLTWDRCRILIGLRSMY